MKIHTLLIIIIIAGMIAILVIERYEKNAVSEEGGIEVMFCNEQNCTQRFVELVSSSEEIVCALYDPSDPSLRRVLEQKRADILVDEDNYYGYGMNVSSRGLMHNKFCVLDRKKVITGSHNPTGYMNYDNMLIISSKTLAANYESEFLEISGKPSGKQKREVTLNSSRVRNYFCPEDRCTSRIVSALRGANKSILFMAFTFTDDGIADALIEKHKEGVLVRGVIESYQARQHWEYEKLVENGIDAVLEESQTLQHNKVFIIDEGTVVTGSYNPTRAADTVNDENVLIISDPVIAKNYTDYFYRVSAEALADAD